MNSVTTKDHNNGHRKRLREKFLAGAHKAFPDYEILEMLLFLANPRGDTKRIAKDLLEHCAGSLADIFYLENDNFKLIPGVGDSVVAIILCIKELLERILKEQIIQKPLMNNWKSVTNYLQASIGRYRTENLRALFLNKKGLLISEYIQEVGTYDQTPMYIRELVKKALALGTATIIVAHNHPSGECKPSRADMLLTQQLAKACKSVDIVLADHLIITASEFFSFKMEGLLA